MVAIWILNGVLCTAVVTVILGMLLAAIAVPGRAAVALAAARTRGESQPRAVEPKRDAPRPTSQIAPAGLADRVELLEARDEIRRLMAAYVRARDFGEGAVAELFTSDAVWEGLGQLADVLGRHEGRSAIAERFAASVPPTLHLVANESILVHGNDAVGRWTSLQLMVVDGNARWSIVRYENDFHRSPAGWRIQHIRIEPVLHVRYEDGWARAPFFDRRPPAELVRHAIGDKR